MNYGLTLPDDDTLSARFKYLVGYFKNRNKLVTDMRNMLNGLNPIEMPVSTQYKAKILHSYIMASLINEKTSRYLPMYNVQVIPEGDGISPESRTKATRVETGLNTGNYEIERRSDGDVWGRVIQDAILVDEGVEVVLAAPNPFWTEMVTYEESKKRRAAAKEEGVKESELPELEYEFLGEPDLRTEYKKEKGYPITRRYIPLENFYPQYDGPNLIEGFHVEERNILSVQNNPLFLNERGAEAMKTLPPPSPSGGLDQIVNIVQYVNNNWHCYYLAGPANGRPRPWPKVRSDLGQFVNGSLMYLYGYEHGLGRSLYNCVGGRFGGWKTDENRIEGVGKALLELSQALDEVLSQVFTNTRAKYWPSLNFIMDPDKRGFGPGGTHPTAPTVKEGEALVTFVGEQILPIFKAEEDPMTMWVYDKIMEGITKIGGASILFGEKSPGVDTGYHQALQKTAAENLDEKIEQHISQGAIQDATLVMLHIKELDEEVWCHFAETDPEDKKRKVGKYISVKPEDLTPLPRLDAQVRKPSPVDYIAALAAAEKASDDRQGKGPLLSDDTIRTDILAVEAPDIEHLKILIESQQNELIKSGVIQNKVAEILNMKLAQTGAPTPGPEMLGKVDPALLAAMNQANGPGGPAVQQGGTSPALLSAAAQVNPPSGSGVSPGPTTGNPEPFNRMGEAVSNAMQTGASI